MSMTPMSLTASNSTNNASEGASGKKNPQPSNDNDYAFSYYDPPSAAAAGTVDGDADYKSSPMYESLMDNDGGRPDTKM